MHRCDERGWVKIGVTCTSGRRSMWVRFNYKPDLPPQLRMISDSRTIESFELCAGREGDDEYTKITADNPAFVRLLDVMLAAVFAAET